MLRLFIGLELPDRIKERLLMIEGGVKGARWQMAEQLHLSLRFVGEVDGRAAEDVAGALEGLRFSPFEIALSGLGSFGKPGQPKCLWAGVAPEEPVARLHKKVDHALMGAGLAGAERKFKPHVTLARFSGRAGPIDGYLSTYGDFATGAFPVECISLFRSTLGHGGAHYEVLERYPATA